jgi:crotonobetainyl-CoA:carnitine CoA-transferase CaiB-like acyl-CoA transferase
MLVILDDVRIVDLSQGLAGPLATRLLAEAGADVVKVEPPGGDRMRRLNPTGFAIWNRSKRGVVLDLDDGVDRARLDALLTEADVVVHD